MKVAKQKASEEQELLSGAGYFDIAELIMENKLLVDKFELMMGRQEVKSFAEGPTNIRERKPDDDELSELSQTLIDNLYDKFKGQQKKKKKSTAVGSNSSINNRVTPLFGKPRVISNTRVNNKNVRQTSSTKPRDIDIEIYLPKE